MGLEDLKQITANLNQPEYKDLLVDFKHNDDCGILRIDQNTLLVQSVDFITPIVDDAYIYGQIAAANSLSDVFAKGAKAISAMSVLMWDSEHLDTYDVNAILQGSLEKLIESECPLVGGHSINDTEQKYGLSVSGIIKDNIFWKNNTSKVGDVIILTKPIGSGILTTAFKNDLLEFKPTLDVVRSMATLNLKAAMCAKKYSISACTDVTGYGLIGHLCEMTNAEISISLYYDKILFFENALELADKGAIPGGSYNNKKALESAVKNTTTKSDIICHDAQTSGGLLIALKEKDAHSLLLDLHNEGIDASIIAEVIPKREYKIFIK